MPPDVTPDMRIVYRARRLSEPGAFIECQPTIEAAWLVGGGTATPIPADLADLLSASGIESSTEYVGEVP